MKKYFFILSILLVFVITLATSGCTDKKPLSVVVNFSNDDQTILRPGEDRELGSGYSLFVEQINIEKERSDNKKWEVTLQLRKNGEIIDSETLSNKGIIHGRTYSYKGPGGVVFRCYVDDVLKMETNLVVLKDVYLAVPTDEFEATKETTSAGKVTRETPSTNENTEEESKIEDITGKANIEVNYLGYTTLLPYDRFWLNVLLQGYLIQGGSPQGIKSRYGRGFYVFSITLDNKDYPKYLRMDSRNTFFLIDSKYNIYPPLTSYPNSINAAYGDFVAKGGSGECEVVFEAPSSLKDFHVFYFDNEENVAIFG